MRRKSKLVAVMALLLAALPALAQFGQVQMGPLIGLNCPGAPLLGLDLVNNGLYTCGNNGKGWQPAGSNAPGFSFGASTAANPSYLLPAGTAPTTPAAGAHWVDGQHVPSFAEVSGNTIRENGALFILGAPGTSTVINTATALNGSTVTLQAGLINIAGKTLEGEAYGTYSNTTSTPTVAFAILIGATTEATCTSGAVNNGVTTFPFHLTFTIVVATNGATGTDEAHCALDIVLGASAAGAASKYLDNNTAASAAYDHTAAANLTITGLSAGSSNAALVRTLRLDIKN